MIVLLLLVNVMKFFYFLWFLVGCELGFMDDVEGNFLLFFFFGFVVENFINVFVN